MLRPKQKSAVHRPKADPSAANPLHNWACAFCEWTLVRGLSKSTASIRASSLRYFITWADERGLAHPSEITRPVLQRYQRHLYLARQKNGQPLAWSTQETRLMPLVAFFKWLTREGHVLSNPAADLDMPKRARQLPKHLMSIAQVETVINGTPVHTVQGIRDRAMLEVLYSSGVRRGELIALQVMDIDTERGTLMVRRGKGRKDRLVPLGARACAWVTRYLLEVRPQLLGADTHALFLTDYGEPFEKNRLSDLVKGYMLQAGMAHGNCHAFRHAMATHMHEAGADIRHIQIILGHSQITTTEIYTHVAIEHLKAVHAATHPARVTRANVHEAAQNALQARNTGVDDPTPQQAEKTAHRAFLAELAAQDDEASYSEQIYGKSGH
jgi:integrase/recombinase XerD